MNTIIDVNNLTKTYGNIRAVDDISFHVAEGEIFGLLGPNGAGKTTTVECLQGLRKSDSGNIRVCGFDLRTQARSLKRVIGSQLQESALPDRIKVWEALDLFSSLTQSKIDWQVLMEQWGLKEKRQSSFSSLSGGQRQRLFVALALVTEPKVVFLDEMTTGLDPAARHIAWDLIQSIRDRGSTVMLVTHFMDEAEKICDRVAIINNGKIIDIDTPQGLIIKHTSEVRVIFSTGQKELSWLNEIPQVNKITRRGERMEIEGSGPILALVAAALVEHNIVPVDLRAEQPTLEEVFLKLTGKRVED
jgi:ABC-2 type transport system ATP-binding protein